MKTINVLVGLFLLLLCPSVTVSQSLSSSDGVTRQLTSGAASLEQAFPTNQQSSTDTADANSAEVHIARTLLPLRGVLGSAVRFFGPELAAAYQGKNPAFQMNFLFPTTTTAVKAAYYGGGYDFAIFGSTPLAADYAAKPGIQYFAFQGNAVGVSYNLPASVTNGAVMSFSGLTMCRIHRGNITTWNDPAIVRDNPSMAWSSIAGQSIVILFQNTASAVNPLFVNYCRKIDPGFTIAPASVPNFPTSKFAAWQAFADLDHVNLGLGTIPFSFGITNGPNAKALELPIANFVTPSGTVVKMNSNSMSLNLFELATNGYAAGTNSYDLTNPATPQAWPMMGLSYLYLDSQATLTTCASKKILLEFFIWYYSSTSVPSIANELGILSLPPILVSQLGILDRLRSQILCQNTMLIANTGKQGLVGLNAFSSSIMKLYSSFYLDIDSSRTYLTNTATETLNVQRLVAGEMHLAIVDFSNMRSADISLMKDGGAVALPAFLTGVSPMFTLPTAIAAQVANVASTKTLGLPALFPLVLTLDVMTTMFLGQINSWLDPQLTQLNPQLTAWFATTNADPTLSLVVGSTRSTDPLKGAILLFNVMSHSSVAQLSQNQLMFPAEGWVSPDGTTITNPFSAVISSTSRVASITVTEVESRLTLHSGSIPGSVSYRMLGTASTTTGQTVTDPSTEFQLQIVNSNGATEVVAPTLTALKQCAVTHTSIDGTADSLQKSLSGVDATVLDTMVQSLLDPSTQQGFINPIAPAPGCWPVSTLLSFVASTTYTTAVTTSSSNSVSTSTATANTCDEGSHSLELLHYIQSTPILTAAAEESGIVRLAESSIVRRMTESVIYGATCDGTSLLVIEPFYYSIPGAVHAFGQAISAIGIIVAFVSAVVVFTFRKQVVIRSASVPFLLLILAGMGLLFGALISWSADPSKASCSSFLWLANLGFMLLFLPLFLKTWRVYRIFSGAQLKVIKLSNEKLMLMMAAAFAVDLIILSAWQATSPMTPIQYSKQIGSNFHYYTHCSVNPNGMPFVYIEGIYKCGLLLFGSVMAFSTRNVKGTFNEATQIAWSIYNTLATGLITVVIIVFIAAVENTLIVLVQIFLLWIAYCTWALLFIPKFHLLFQSETEILEASRSELPQEKSGGFSFASAAVMSLIQLKQYYAALKVQIHKVERRLGTKTTPFAEDKSLAVKGISTGTDSAADTNTSGVYAETDDPDVAREKTLVRPSANVRAQNSFVGNSYRPSARLKNQIVSASKSTSSILPNVVPDTNAATAIESVPAGRLSIGPSPVSTGGDEAVGETDTVTATAGGEDSRYDPSPRSSPSTPSLARSPTPVGGSGPEFSLRKLIVNPSSSPAKPSSRVPQQQTQQPQ